MSATCSSCGASMLWGVTPSHARMPLDIAQSDETDPAPGMVALSPRSGRCMVLGSDDTAKARELLEVDLVAGHWPHWDTCPSTPRLPG